jgi:hypothetical protein
MVRHGAANADIYAQSDVANNSLVEWFASNERMLDEPEICRQPVITDAQSYLMARQLALLSARA